LTESDFRFYVTLKMAVMTSYNKVLPAGEWTRSVCRHLRSRVRQFL